MINEIIKLRDSYDAQHPKYWAINEVIEQLQRLTPPNPVSAQLEAIRLIELFTCYAIDLPNSKRREYAVFSAAQHITNITTPDLPLDKIVFNLAVAGEIEKRK